jgi:adenine nucleotide transporter 17
MIKKIFSEEGMSGFFKGIVPSLILTIVPVIQFTSYEVLKKIISDPSGNISNKNVVMISFLTKFISIMFNYPLMTLKTLYQSNSSLTNNEIVEILKKVLHKEGIFGLYKGLGSKMFGSVLNDMVLMLTYERLQNIVRLILVRVILGKSSFKLLA